MYLEVWLSPTDLNVWLLGCCKLTVGVTVRVYNCFFLYVSSLMDGDLSILYPASYSVTLNKINKSKMSHKQDCSIWLDVSVNGFPI